MSAASARDGDASPGSSPIHHESQRLMLCAVHCINALLQSDGPHVTKAEMDSLCDHLDAAEAGSARGGIGRLLGLNPHRHWAGLGDYDVNVMMAALGHRGYQIAFHDSRRPIRENEHVVRIVSAEQAQIHSRDGVVDSSTAVVPDRGAGVGATAGVLGFIINTRTKFLGLTTGRHWIAVRQIGPMWYNLDSRLAEPKELGGSDGLIEYLQTQIDEGNSVLVAHSAGVS